MPVKYENGKIYKLYCKEDPSIFNIGSTAQMFLSSRKSGHKATYIRYKNGKGAYRTSFKVFEAGTAVIELLEQYPCSSVEELRGREGYWQRKIPDCVNKRIEGRTKQEYYEDNLETFKAKNQKYYENNKDRLKENYDRYRKNNKEKIKKQRQAYREKNIERIKEKDKTYRENNKDKIKERRKKQYERNKDKIKLKSKEYNLRNKEKIKEYAKTYYQRNKDKLLQKAKINYQRNKETIQNEKNTKV